MRRARIAGLVAAPIAAAAAIAWLVAPGLFERRHPPLLPPLVRIRVAGTELSGAGDRVADALDAVRRFARGSFQLKLPDGSTRQLSAGALGAEIDRERLTELVRAALDPHSPLGRAYAARSSADPTAVIDLPLPIHIGAQAAVRALAAIKDAIDQPPRDAAVDLDKRAIRPERVGFRLDVYGTLARLDAAMEAGQREIEAAVDRIAPRVSASQLGAVEFDHVLGWFETRYARDEKHRARSYNLRLAASRLDGTVLLPGASFDFNSAVGPRDEAHGYKVAPVIAEGELVDGIGGGTCQISGTLHAAAFFAGLPIGERAPHTRPSAYIKLGLDAAVAYPTIDFKLQNDFGFAVVLHETVQGGVVRAEILGPRRSRTVSFFRRIDEVIPFDEQVRETDELPKGKRVLSQRGVPGFKITVIRVVREGAYAWRTAAHNQYPPTAQIVRLGTGGKDASGRVKLDHSPEYRADEYEVLTQGPEIRTPGVAGSEPGGGMVESRTPGRYGAAGWQKQLGMKVFEDEREQVGDVPGDGEHG